MTINAGGLIMIVVLNAILIPRFGIQGALYSTLFSLTATQLLIHYRSQIHYPLQLPVLRIVCCVFLLFLLVDWTIG